MTTGVLPPMDAAEWVTRLRMHALRLWDDGLGSPADAVAHLTAMQAQEHPYARWSVGQRTTGSVRASAVDRAFDDGHVLRTHVLRPTWHYVAKEDMRWLIALSGPRVEAGNARRFRELALDARTLARTNDIIAEAVADAPRSRRELADVLERRGIDASGQRVAHIVMHAELSAVVCSGPMRGRQHTYAAFDQRVPPGTGPVGDDALRELARRYFATRGPATLQDFVWWSGLSTPQARHTLELATPQLSSRAVDDRTYWFAEQTLPRTTSRVDLVQCYDEVIISYGHSRDALQTPRVTFPVPRHVAGFVHVLLLDGRLLGHWRTVQSRHGVEVQTRITTSVDRSERHALADAIERYRRFAEPSPNADGPNVPRARG